MPTTLAENYTIRTTQRSTLNSYPHLYCQQMMHQIKIQPPDPLSSFPEAVCILSISGGLPFCNYNEQIYHTFDYNCGINALVT
jgi:hypothetical protein